LSITIAMSLNLKGMLCPLPIMKTAKAMNQLAPGLLVEVLATDPRCVSDFKAWSRATGNRLVESSHEAGVFHFILEKKEGGVLR